MTPIAQPEPSHHRALKAVVAVIVLVLVVGAISLVPKSALSNLAKNNIFSLVGDLNGTTGQMLQHTKALQKNVGNVKNQLSQLETQQQIVQQQTATGQQLQQQMTTQKQLTTNGVNLMEQILTKESALSHVTAKVANQTGQLTGIVHDNATVLNNLLSALSTSNQESNKLSGQLDQLLAQLGQSEQEFKFFGQVNQLLGGLLGKSGGSTSKLPGLSGLTGGLTGVLSGGSKSNTTTSGSGSTSGSASGTNPVQTLLNGLL